MVEPRRECDLAAACNLQERIRLARHYPYGGRSRHDESPVLYAARHERACMRHLSSACRFDGAVARHHSSALDGNPWQGSFVCRCGRLELPFIAARCRILPFALVESRSVPCLPAVAAE